MNKNKKSFKKWWNSLLRKQNEQNELAPLDQKQNEDIRDNQGDSQKAREVPMYGGKYDAIFLTSSFPIPMSVVHEELWDVIFERLPDQYTIPATSSMYLYNNASLQNKSSKLEKIKKGND